MNLKIQLPKTNLSMMEWFIKHNVSSEVCGSVIAISRAMDSQEIAQ